MSAPTAVQRLGRLVAETPATAFSDAVRERARISLLHNLAVAQAGRRREGVAWRLAEGHFALPAQATLLATGGRANIEGAALANGALIHARSQDDTHPDSTSHPGAPVMAAALALGQARGATGAAFLEAVILGYEVLCRIGEGVDQAITARGFRCAAVLGGFGAAAAAARLMRLDAAQTAHALALAAQSAGGLAQVWAEGSAEGPLQLGLSARSGVTAALAASCGATGAALALEGPRGFWQAYAGGQPKATERDGWRIAGATIKPHPACAILQGPLDLLAELQAGDDRLSRLEPDRLRGLVLALNPYEAGYPGVDAPGPATTPAAAKMSARFCIAAALLDGRLTMAHLDAPADPRIAALARRITVRRDPALPLRACRLEFDLADGPLAVDLTRPSGQPDRAGAERVAAGLAAEAGLSLSEAAALATAVAGIDTAPNLTALVAAACARAGLAA